MVMFKKSLVVALLLSTITGSYASDEKEFKEWLKQYKKEFKTFVDEHDKEFAQFLKANWVETEVEPEVKRDSKPKVTAPPKTKPEPIVEVEADPQPVVLLPPAKPVEPVPPPEIVKKPDPVPSEPELVHKPTEPKPLPKPKPKPVVKPAPEQFVYVKKGESRTTVRMLGQTLVMPKLDAKPLGIRKLDSNTIADSWLSMAKTQFKDQVAAIKAAADDLALDDWGQALLTHEYLVSGSRLSKNDMQLYSWFYLVKQGFNSRVAYNDGKAYLMLSVKQKLFGQKYFSLKDGKYYFVDLAEKQPISVGSVYTYDKQHSSASEQVNIDLSVAPKHGTADKSRKLTTTIDNKSVTVSTHYNSSYIEFLDHYPQLSMEYYFQAELPDGTKQELLNQLRPYILGMSEQRALNVILHFVQKSLRYQTDQQQFNYENYLFAGETIHYPYADCEDRAVLFAYLVKNLLGNEVVGLQYDGHIATAVAVKSDIQGDAFTVRGKRFVVADPTFINANIGRTMTGYENQSPQIISF